MIRRASLLVVDDNEINRDVLSRRLQHAGYEVAVAEDGREALARIEEGLFDLILLDVEMPGFSGLDTLSELRETRSQTELPVIMVTARTSGSDVVEAFRRGANDYVTKPIDFPVALARIATHLAHKRAVEDLRTSEERYALAIRGANDGLWDWDLMTNEVHWSPRWKAMIGYDVAEIGDGLDEWLNRVHKDDLDSVRIDLDAHLAEDGHFESEHRLLHRDGTYRWMLCRARAVRSASGAAIRLVGSLTDITEAKIADALTGLPNRLLFLDLVGRALERAERHREYAFALLMLGLDRFKVVADSLGPLSADRLLVEVAARLRDQPGMTVARLEGDEFAVLVDEIADASNAVRIAERLRASLQTPFDVDGQQVYMSASIGIATSRSGYRQPEDIIRDAATALHRAAAGGSTSCELFDPTMRERAVARLQLETDLQNAIERDAFLILYQPIVALATGEITGFEALVRWHHPDRGIVGPQEFIPIAEDTGMLVPIGRFVLAESCRQLAGWLDRFGAAAPRFISVNVSPRQFAHADFVDEIASLLRDTGLHGSRLRLEITESVFIGDEAAAQAVLNRLKELGIGWSIDDFGTGYSSLSYLHRLHAGAVKVDRSFVSRMGGGDGGSEMVRSIVGLARNLGMAVIAEGVETTAQLDELRDLGCDYAQGFFFSKPVDAGRAAGLIEGQRQAPSPGDVNFSTTCLLNVCNGR